MSRFKSGPLKAIDDFKRANQRRLIPIAEQVASASGLTDDELQSLTDDELRSILTSIMALPAGDPIPDPPLQSSSIFDLETPFTMADVFAIQDGYFKAKLGITLIKETP